MRSYITAITAITAVALCATSTNAAILAYAVSGTINGNFITSGGFAGAPSGAPVSLVITVDTATIPLIEDPTRSFWDTIPGTILAVQASVNGYTSVITPNSVPTRARVANDALLSGGPNRYDQFWMEVAALGAAPDFLTASFTLSSIGPGPAVPSSLIGTAWPTDSSQVSVPSFTNEKQIVLRLTGPQFLTATITNVAVVPTPGALTFGALASFACTRRRRATV